MSAEASWGKWATPCPPLPFWVSPVLAPQVCLGSSLTPSQAFTVHVYVSTLTVVPQGWPDVGWLAGAEVEGATQGVERLPGGCPKVR